MPNIVPWSLCLFSAFSSSIIEIQSENSIFPVTQNLYLRLKENPVTQAKPIFLGNQQRRKIRFDIKTAFADDEKWNFLCQNCVRLLECLLPRISANCLSQLLCNPRTTQLTSCWNAYAKQAKNSRAKINCETVLTFDWRGKIRSEHLDDCVSDRWTRSAYVLSARQN